MGTKKTTPAGPEGKGLKVVPKRDGFRRAGHVFTGEGKTIAYADLTEEQVEQLRGEKMLVVAEVDLPKDEPAKGEPAKGEPAKGEPAKGEPAKGEPAK